MAARLQEADQPFSEVRPVRRETGHLDVTLTFTAEQLAEVRAFSVCFTAPGEPDLGCAVKEYAP